MISDTICMDGKKHLWKTITVDMEDATYTVRRYDWCRKCGSLTEFIKGFRAESQWKRCEDEGKYYIEIPELAKKEES